MPTPLMLFMTFFSLVLIILVSHWIDSGINVNDCVHTRGSKPCLKQQANTAMDMN